MFIKPLASPSSAIWNTLFAPMFASVLPPSLMSILPTSASCPTSGTKLSGSATVPKIPPILLKPYPAFSTRSCLA